MVCGWSEAIVAIAIIVIIALMVVVITVVAIDEGVLIQIDALESGVVDLDLSTVKVRHIQVLLSIECGDCASFVNGVEFGIV